jgi:hypothetical protein
MKTLIVVLASLVTAFNLGGSENPASAFFISVLLGVTASRISIVWQNSKVKRLVAILVIVVSTFIGYRLGSTEFADAYNDCVQRAEPMRLAILAYHAKESRFPNTIEETTIDICGERMLRPRLVNYTVKGDDFEQSFSDFLTTWRGSKVELMEARK